MSQELLTTRPEDTPEQAGKIAAEVLLTKRPEEILAYMEAQFKLATSDGYDQVIKTLDTLNEVLMGIESVSGGHTPETLEIWRQASDLASRALEAEHELYMELGLFSD